MFCPTCARELPDDAAFCYACGTHIEGRAPARPPDAGATLAGIGPFEELMNRPLEVAPRTGDTLMGPGTGPHAPAAPEAGFDRERHRHYTPIAAHPASGMRAPIEHLRAATPFPPSHSYRASRSSAEPSGSWGGSHEDRLRSLRAVRDSILTDRARHSGTFEAARRPEPGSSEGEDLDYPMSPEDSYETELMRRDVQRRRNLVIVGVAAGLGLFLAVGGFIIGRVSGSPEDGAASVDAEEEEMASTDSEEDSPETPVVMEPVGDVPDEGTDDLDAPDETLTGTDTDRPKGKKGGGGAAARPPRPPAGGGAAPGTSAPAGATSAPSGGGTGPGAGGGTTTSAPSGGGGKKPSTTSDPRWDDVYGAGGAGVGEDSLPSESWIDESGVAMVVRHHLPKVRGCFNRRAKIDPTLSGRVEVQFRIGTDGNVTKAYVLSDTTGDSLVGQCIVLELKEWRFPRPTSGPIDLVYPFVFAARK